MYNIDEIKNRIILGDAFEELKKIPDESIDLIITDPPYGVNYKGGQHSLGEKNVISGDEKFDYRSLIKECYRILKIGGGGMYMFYADGKENDIFPIDNFEKHQVLIWYKLAKVGHGDFLARYKHNYEPILYLIKKSPTKWRGLNNQVNVFMDFVKENILHPTQKPLKLIKKLIENSSDENDIVLDPFIGSGTTAVAAKILKRNYIGIEIDKNYVELTNQRLKSYDTSNDKL